MEYPRFLDCLSADYTRLRAVAAADLTGAVPTCPGWTVADLARHVGEVYLHKTLAIREGKEPEPWPPAELAGVTVDGAPEAVAELRRCIVTATQ